MGNETYKNNPILFQSRQKMFKNASTRMKVFFPEYYWWGGGGIKMDLIIGGK